MITENERLAGAIDAAAELWPELASSRSALVRKIIDSGIDSVEQERTSRHNVRRSAVERSAGALTGTWPSDWREQLRDEWPA